MRALNFAKGTNMNRILLAVLMLWFVHDARAALPQPQVVKINERVYALIGPQELPNKTNQGYMVNSTVIIGDQGVIVVDTGFSDEIGAHLAQAIAKITPKPVTHVINTHHHGDHYLGNSAFPKAEIISSEQCKEIVTKSGQDAVALVEQMTQRKFPNTKPIPATLTFKEDTKTEKTMQGVKFVLWVPKGSHTPDDLLVYLPDDKVLIGGDVLVNQVTPNFREGHVKTWVETLQKVQAMDFQTAVPGHGPLMNKADVAAMHKRMVTLYAGVEAGYKKGLSDSEIRKTLDLSQWQKLKRFDEMGANINRVFLEVEAANF